MRTAIQKNKTTQAILKKISQGSVEEFTKKDKFLLFQERIYMLTNLRKEIVAEQHELPIHKHQGQQKTLKRISRHYYFLHIKKLVEEHLQKYIYQRTKNSRHLLYKKLQPLQIPERA